MKLVVIAIVIMVPFSIWFNGYANDQSQKSCVSQGGQYIRAYDWNRSLCVLPVKK